MDWKTFGTGLIAIAASAITAGAVLYGQIITQQHEDIRHVRRLAYEFAMEEWRTKVETIRDSGKYEPLPHFEDHLAVHLGYASVIFNHGPENVSQARSAEYLEKLIQLAEERSRQRAAGNEIEGGKQDAGK